MSAATSFTRPVRATHHCRHYSYRHADLISECGPQCARGLDLSMPGASLGCMPDQARTCTVREEYTEAERRAGGIVAGRNVQLVHGVNGGRAVQRIGSE